LRGRKNGWAVGVAVDDANRLAAAERLLAAQRRSRIGRSAARRSEVLDVPLAKGVRSLVDDLPHCRHGVPLSIAVMARDGSLTN